MTRTALHTTHETARLQWQQANQRYLLAALALIKQRLQAHLARYQDQPDQLPDEHTSDQLQQALEEAAAAMPAPASLTTLCKRLALSPFERDLLLLCAGVELDSQFAALCTEAQRSETQQPTFSLALALFPHAHWDALTPVAPLRAWHLITVPPAPILTQAPLSIEESILHYLVGTSCLDQRLAPLVMELPALAHTPLVPSHNASVATLVQAWSAQRGQAEMHRQAHNSPQYLATTPPIIQLCGEDVAAQYAIATHTCTSVGLALKRLSCHSLPQQAAELALLVRLWEREARLQTTALLLDCHEMETTDTTRSLALTYVIQHLTTPLILASRERLFLPTISRPLLTLDVAKPTTSEQSALWQAALPIDRPDLHTQIAALTEQFRLNASSIEAVALEVTAHAALHTTDPASMILWERCRAHARPRLDALAQQIEPQAGWHHLVLPPAQHKTLHEIIAQVRQRTMVYETWGMRQGNARGLGISTLFAGASGTGKTLAAEVLAHELHLDLYRLDLSAVVSKYIGETEKNLRRIFDAAEEGGVVLLFDEADTLFGKRSEVKDSHDRYANIEVGYLLQRMESYHGLAILTTNFRKALDGAFVRRIRFIVQFPFPDKTQRLELWQRMFPATLPTRDLDCAKLAQLNITGGTIRNIALNAAFLAADAGESLQMHHLLQAAGTEYTKLEKPLTEAEIGGWV